jgi:hypothetical protein
MVIIDDSRDSIHKEIVDKIEEIARKLKPAVDIKYIKNKEKKYVGYNILHAAFSYCEIDDIQMYIDGSF